MLLCSTTHYTVSSPSPDTVSLGPPSLRSLTVVILLRCQEIDVRLPWSALPISSKLAQLASIMDSSFAESTLQCSSIVATYEKANHYNIGAKVYRKIQ